MVELGSGYVPNAVQDSAVFGHGRASVDAVLAEFLAGKQHGASCAHVLLFIGWLRECLVGGKRLRPLLCWCGWQAAGGHGDPAVVARVAASLELFHAFALLHDDVMDGSDTRRGRATAQRRIAALHPEHPDADWLGVHTAVLLGDLALGWSYDLVQTAGLAPAQAAVVWPLLDAMRTDTLAGQYLDLTGTGGVGAATVEQALDICRLKTATYTVARPLQLGAALAQADQTTLKACTSYGIPLGEAFQLRDDLLGVFGDPTITGKPSTDDLRAGKPTVLLALAWEHATSAQRDRLRALVGNPTLDDTGAAEARQILTTTGARATVENMITIRQHQALAALDTAPFHPTAITTLQKLATTATHRNR